jgi:hypothetical protein
MSIGNIRRDGQEKSSGWHAALEELTLRINARPEERERFERESALERSIAKIGGGVLTLVNAEAKISGTWTSLDKKGNRSNSIQLRICGGWRLFFEPYVKQC